MRFLLLGLIRCYQRWISPHKGFGCAWRIYTGHASCSWLGYRAVRRYGVIQGLRVTRARTQRCSAAHRALRHRCLNVPAGQAGFIDLDCPGCDLPDNLDICDVFDFMECGCNVAQGCSPWDSEASKRNQDRVLNVRPRIRR